MGVRFISGVRSFWPSDLRRAEEIESTRIWQHRFDICQGTFSINLGGAIACTWHKHMKRTRACWILDNRSINTDSEWRRAEADEALQWASIELSHGCWLRIEREVPTNDGQILGID